MSTSDIISLILLALGSSFQQPSRMLWDTRFFFVSHGLQWRPLNLYVCGHDLAVYTRLGGTCFLRGNTALPDVFKE